MEKLKIITNCKTPYLVKLMKKISRLSIPNVQGYKNKVFIVDVSTINDDLMRELNLKYRGMRRTTTSLAFPYMDSWKDNGMDYINLGQIVISLETVERRAGLHKNSFEREFADTYLHAFLHLLGYDHITKQGRKVMREIHKRIIEEVWGSFETV